MILIMWMPQNYYDDSSIVVQVWQGAVKQSIITEEMLAHISVVMWLEFI